MAELTGKAISELQAAANVTNIDLFAISQNGATKKVTAEVLLSGVNTDIDSLSRAVAIVAIGNNHSAISAGQYVYVKNHSAVATGLYVATTDIAQNASLSSSNLRSTSGGGLNELNKKIAYSEITSGITAGIRVYKFGRVAMLDFETCTLASDVPANTVFSSLTSAYYPVFPISFLDSIQKKRIIIDATGRIQSGGEALSAGVLRGVITYITVS